VIKHIHIITHTQPIIVTTHIYMCVCACMRVRVHGCVRNLYIKKRHDTFATKQVYKSAFVHTHREYYTRALCINMNTHDVWQCFCWSSLRQRESPGLSQWAVLCVILQAVVCVIRPKFWRMANGEWATRYYRISAYCHKILSHISLLSQDTIAYHYRISAYC